MLLSKEHFESLDCNWTTSNVKRALVTWLERLNVWVAQVLWLDIVILALYMPKPPHDKARHSGGVQTNSGHLEFFFNLHLNLSMGVLAL